MRRPPPFLIVIFVFCCAFTNAWTAPPRTFVIGDSLSAEYETVSWKGLSDITEATAYAEITVPGWVSMSWVEVLGALRPAALNFGNKGTYLDLRLNGYEYNYAIPGSEALQWRRLVNASPLSDPVYWSVRFTSGFDEDLEQADCVVIWIGANEFRANYGFIYDGGNPNSLISGLLSDLETVVDYVKNKNNKAKIVLCNLPHLGATPNKRAAHGTSPTGIGRITQATETANQKIATLAAEKGAVLADVYSQTASIVNGETSWFRAVPLHPESHADNHPLYQFTRDGLHPNTCAQIEIARRILAAINTAMNSSIPQITDTEALQFLGIHPDKPYFDWLAANNLPNQPMEGDSDGDGASNLLEYAFDLDPNDPNEHLPELAAVSTPSGAQFQWPALAPDRARHLILTPLSSTNLIDWNPVPSDEIEQTGDTLRWISDVHPAAFLRLEITVSP
jgi:lysophospholipase L1-like esterase